MTQEHAQTFNSLRHWTEALEKALADSQWSHISRVHVIGETTSTQDACRHNVIDAGGLPGVAVTTLRQHAGRGRLGRAWNDPEGHGVACSVAVAVQPPERLALAGALAACLAVEHVTKNTLMPRIRWPNDVMLETQPDIRRKVAGVLVEVPVDPPVAVIGIGLNVHQQKWASPLDQIAISLAQAGVTVSRLDLVTGLLGCLDQTLDWADSRLIDEFSARDLLTGTTATFEHAGRRHTGVVLDIDPMQGLRIRTADGTIKSLPALTTSLIHDQQV
ncbi:MAG: biotin--[acetyl-CoA-carboxylase] ligase [Planctomycetes bacterium]|nr:biotin--[acetyl-CoA-carboxylase] ligase [Planctomycetota bacterium]NOG54362.1 biotin--[acetyl-CoA-carboxylase] ligase [Planctomycetota bacterium]